MAFVTKLALQGGDKAVLDRVVDDLKQSVERKDAECRDPHSDQPKQVSVPQYRTPQLGDQFSSWTYPVYTRRLEIHGADQIARGVGLRGFPDGIHLEIEVEQEKPFGHCR